MTVWEGLREREEGGVEWQKGCTYFIDFMIDEGIFTLTPSRGISLWCVLIKTRPGYKHKA